MYTQYFFIEGTYLAESSRGPWKVQTTIREPPSSLFYCPICGNTWARVQVEHGGIVHGWQAYSRICQKCPSDFKYEAPGSIWLSWDQEYLNKLPLAVLKREFLLLYNWRFKNG